MIQACRIHSQHDKLLRLFNEMNERGVTPNEHVYSSVLRILAENKNTAEGAQIHQQLKVPIKYLLISKSYTT